ncbi:hypothetical protein GGI07_000008 [Coemansia sp. Benny D115]|nr:hypothetical protein GGI07_000008 [Coemansia sp. Benny D115]
MGAGRDSGFKTAAKGVAILAFLVMLHAGYSARELLLYSKSIGRQDPSLPVEIVFECLGALAIMTVAVVAGVGELKPVSYESEMKRYSVDGIYSRSSFQVFNHRGRFLRPGRRSLFEDRYALGVAVKASRHPELNQYIADAVAAVKAELSQNNAPSDVMIEIIDGQQSAIESFLVELSSVGGMYESRCNVPGLFSAARRWRTIIGKASCPLTHRNAWIPRLSESCTAQVSSPGGMEDAHDKDPRLVQMLALLRRI